MIISHQHRFIFVHCRKVAGSSTKVSLAPHLGPEDILLGSQQEVWRDCSFFEPDIQRLAMTFEGLRELATGLLRKRNWRDSLSKANKRRYKRIYGLSSSAHPPAAEVRRVIPEAWEDYFKFCFVRNPYERAVSDYLYLTRRETQPPSFSDYIHQLEQSGRDAHGRVKHDNWPMYTVNDVVAVDFVGRYENLVSDFNQATERAGLPGVTLEASEKRRKYVRPWREYYAGRDRERVEALYEREIHHFGYTFE